MAPPAANPPDPLAAALQGVTHLVMDASLALDALIGEPARKALALRFFALCNAGPVRLIVPPTFASEADSAVIQGVLRGRLSAAAAPAYHAALDALAVDVALDGAELDAVRQRARVIAAELQQPGVYDATYAALAEARVCLFWTADKTFANAAKQTRRQPDGKGGVVMGAALPVVRYIGDYSTT